MKPVKIFFLIVGFTLFSVGINSCKKEQTKIHPEASKNIVGTWKIASVIRNGVDITPYFDFAPFSIEFKEDGSYIVNNQAPFVISKNGTWSLDDPTHPLHISFRQEGASQTFTNEFDYPVVEGARRIVLRGAPGCTSNTYQYSLVAQ
ncbi:hypothetical protein A8C56_20585 [Niabella ginsenosidivorans]|uniref:DUF5004 domain-containing protein n=1 Tax=Niabella ginsenosidivorans TaxID=1176587 RepID=A0A1A9I8Q5_9BACT|nr:DUF5004 domain-containing protein [Niabella ginsenosidivorans]ANH83061.1 hypothetical protein A8C56_20585 [Niabella ginsenosidivorans]